MSFLELLSRNELSRAGKMLEKKGEAFSPFLPSVPLLREPSFMLAAAEPLGRWPCCVVLDMRSRTSHLD